MFRLSVIIAVILALSGSMPAFGQNLDDLALQARDVLKKHCSGCHTGPGSENGYQFDAVSVESMIKKFAEDEPAVLVPKKPDESRIWIRAGIEKNMPPKSKPRLSESELKTIKDWISAGAPAANLNRKITFLTTTNQLQAITKHLANVPRDVRPYIRFFTLTNLHNNPSVTTDDLRVTRAALSKSINSMSRQPRLAIPKPIDAEETIYWIDLREVGWKVIQQWSEVMKQYPYGLDYAGSSDPVLRQTQQDLDQLTQGNLVYIRADWFVANATRPPLYHVLLDLPKTAIELRNQLRVDRDRNIESGSVWRAGFQASGVSGQNRLVERHDSPIGVYYWESYDFLPRKPRANLLRFPLGPIFAENSLPKQAFDHDGGEMIFGLANGLQGYYLADGKGNRLDQGPLDVVSDGLKTSGTPAIVNGMSCIYCHKNGMIPCVDTVRVNHSLSGDAKDKIEKLYSEPDKFNSVQKADEERFMAALEKTIGPFLRHDRDRLKPIRDLQEPVGEVVRSYRVGNSSDISLQKACAELGIEKPDAFAAMIRSYPALNELGVMTLANGKTVKRDDWDSIDGTSLFQDIALALRLATPLRSR